MVTSALVPSHHAIALVELEGKLGFTEVEADDLARFVPIPELEPPNLRLPAAGR